MFVDKWRSVFPFWRDKLSIKDGVSYQWPAKWLPLLNIRSKAKDAKRPRVSIGFIAIGDIAIGVFSGGGISVGVISAGGVAFGMLSLGGVAHTWFLGIGAVAVVLPGFSTLPGIGIGALAVALRGFGIGILAIARSAIGVVAIGRTAFGLVAIGAHGWGLNSLIGDAIKSLKHLFD